MDFSLELMVPAMRYSPQMRAQRRTFAFGGDEVECEPQRYAWSDGITVNRTSSLPRHIANHVPPSHRTLGLEVIFVAGGLEGLVEEGAGSSGLEALLRYQLVPQEPWVAIFFHDDDGVDGVYDGDVDDFVHRLRGAVISPPKRGFIVVHHAVRAAVVHGPYR